MINRPALALALGLLVAGAPALPAAAQQDAPVDLGTWSYDALAQGWRGNALIGSAVEGADGAQRGTVRDLAIGATGLLEMALVEGPDGAMHAVPWDDLAYDGGGAATLAGSERLDSYPPPGDPAVDQGQNRASLFLVSQVMDTPLGVEDEQRFGRVADLVFGAGGRLEALVIADAGPDGRQIALPWRAVRLDPEGGLLTAPYDTAELGRLAPFSDDTIAE